VFQDTEPTGSANLSYLKKSSFKRNFCALVNSSLDAKTMVGWHTVQLDRHASVGKEPQAPLGFRVTLFEIVKLAPFKSLLLVD
jgi:hypothetical protein